MRLSDGMERRMIKLLDHTELTNTEIAEAVGIHRQDVEKFKRRRNEQLETKQSRRPGRLLFCI